MRGDKLRRTVTTPKADVFFYAAFVGLVILNIVLKLGGGR